MYKINIKYAHIFGVCVYVCVFACLFIYYFFKLKRFLIIQRKVRLISVVKMNDQSNEIVKQIFKLRKY